MNSFQTKFTTVEDRSVKASVVGDSDQNTDLFPTAETKEVTQKDTVVSNMIDYRELLENNEESKNIVKMIKETIVDGTPSYESLRKEAETLDNRYASTAYSFFSAAMLARAGIQGANNLLVAAEEQLSTIDYFRSLIRSNPKKYIADKASSIMQNVSAFTQGSAYLLGTLKQDKAAAYQASAVANESNTRAYAMRLQGESQQTRTAVARELAKYVYTPAWQKEYASAKGKQKEKMDADLALVREFAGVNDEQ